MLYWPTLADLFGTLPLVEQAELITLADTYGVPLEPETADGPGS